MDPLQYLDEYLMTHVISFVGVIMDTEDRKFPWRETVLKMQMQALARKVPAAHINIHRVLNGRGPAFPDQELIKERKEIDGHDLVNYFFHLASVSRKWKRFVDGVIGLVAPPIHLDFIHTCSIYENPLLEPSICNCSRWLCKKRRQFPLKLKSMHCSLPHERPLKALRTMDARPMTLGYLALYLFQRGDKRYSTQWDLQAQLLESCPNLDRFSVDFALESPTVRISPLSVVNPRLFAHQSITSLSISLGETANFVTASSWNFFQDQPFMISNMIRHLLSLWTLQLASREKSLGSDGKWAFSPGHGRGFGGNNDPLIIESQSLETLIVCELYSQATTILSLKCPQLKHFVCLGTRVDGNLYTCQMCTRPSRVPTNARIFLTNKYPWRAIEEVVHLSLTQEGTVHLVRKSELYQLMAP